MSSDGFGRTMTGRRSVVFGGGAALFASLAGAWGADPPQRADPFAGKVDPLDGIVLKGHRKAVFAAAFSPDGESVVSASYDGTARIWDARSGAMRTVLRGHAHEVSSAVFSPDGAAVLTASWDRTARLWDAATGKTIRVFSGHKKYVEAAAFSPDAKRIVTASDDRSARIWDTTSGACIATLRGHKRVVTSAAFSPDGTRVLTASFDKTAGIWDAAGHAPPKFLTGHTDYIRHAAYSRDGKYIVTASDDFSARLWDAASGDALNTIEDGFCVYWAAFLNRDDLVATVTGRDVHVWNGLNGKPRFALRWTRGDVMNPVNSVAVSPDGTRLAVAIGNVIVVTGDIADKLARG